MDLMREQMLRNGSIGPRDEQQDIKGSLVWCRQVQQFHRFMTIVCDAVGCLQRNRKQVLGRPLFGCCVALH